MQLYKTRRFTGHDELQLEKDTELCRLLKQYVVEFWPSLCKVDTEGSFLFVVSDLNLAHLRSFE